MLEVNNNYFNPSLVEAASKEGIALSEDFAREATNLALKAISQQNYTKFDAQTTTTCCHGVSVIKWDLSRGLTKMETLALSVDLVAGKIIAAGEKLSDSYSILTKLFLLGAIKEPDDGRLYKTVVNNLKKISPAPNNKVCRKLVSYLQKDVANLVAGHYFEITKEIPDDLIIGTQPLSLWRKYVSPTYCRIDRRERRYAPCLFSMQVSLAYLSFKQAFICINTDIRDQEGNLTGQYLQIMQGNAKGSFSKVDSYDKKEPIVVFGAVVYDNSATPKSVAAAMEPWLDKFSELVLACDTKYPQFPRVVDDPGFDSSPIIPEEPELQETIANAKETQGVCSKDPTLFCLVHIYVASGKEIQENTLPRSFLSKVARQET